MKYTTAIVALMTAAVSAAPNEARWGSGGGGGGGTTNTCSSSQSQVCCDGLLDCVVSVIGSTCGGSSYCCETNAPVGTLVNVALLNCVSLL